MGKVKTGAEGWEGREQSVTSESSGTGCVGPGSLLIPPCAGTVILSKTAVGCSLILPVLCDLGIH